MRIRAVLIAAGVLAPLALWAALPLGSSGAPATAARAQQLDRQLAQTRSKLAKKRGREKVLTSDVAVYSRKIGALQGSISALERREAAIQADLDAQRAVLFKTQDRLRSERARLVRLRSRLRESRALLAQRLVAVYKDDQPDLVTVVLQADGFADLLERADFIGRVSDQDQRIIVRVRVARVDAARTAKELGVLENRQQRVAARILDRRDEVAAVKGELVRRRSGFDAIRSEKSRVLASVRTDRHALQQHVDDLESESAKVQAALQGGAGGGGGPAAGPIKRGSGRLIWPVTGPITGAFGEQRPGHLHAGIDIAAPIGTPIRAADSGRVVLLGWTGGYGNYTCVQHTATMSTCYAHQSRYGTSNGANVRQGQIIGYVGNTGHSFGAHLHFEVRINGVPQQPLNYL